MRLARSDLRGEDAEVQPLREAHLLEVTVQEPAGIEGIRDEAELQATSAQRLQQRVRVRAEEPGRIPGRVLGLEIARELVVLDLHVEVPEELPDETGVLDLLDGSGHPEERLVAFPEV